VSHELLKLAVQSSMKKDPPQFQIGDTVRVSVRIIEGDKERTQVFMGTVIARRGAGISENFTVRRIVNNEGVERTFPVHSPKVTGVEVVRSGKVRRAKLYYLRDRVGKATRLKTLKRSVAKKDKVEVPADDETYADEPSPPAESASQQPESKD
jgi:large subunit ribosomal protein L19